MAFFASPAKAYLKRSLAERAAKAVGAAKVEGREGLHRVDSTDSLTGRRDEIMLGLPSDPERDMDEAIAEVRGEIGRRRAMTAERLKGMGGVTKRVGQAVE